MLVWLGFRFGAEKCFRETWAALLVIPYLLASSLFRFHCLTGMETTCSLLVNALFVLALVRWSRERSWPALFLCLFAGYVSFLTRPDNGVYVLLLPPLFMAAVERKFSPYALRYAGLFAVVLVVDAGLKKILFGDIVPLAFFAKSNGFYRGYLGAQQWNAMREMLTFMGDVLPLFVILFCLVNRRTLLQIGAIVLTVAATWGYLLSVTQIMGFYARYYYPTLPFLVLAVLVAIDGHVRKDDGSPSAAVSRAGRLFLVLIVLVGLIFSGVGSALKKTWSRHVIGCPVAFAPARRYVRPPARRLPVLTWWNGINGVNALLNELPPGIVMAASEYGLIGAAHPQMLIIDPLGLHDRVIARHGFSATRFFSRKPDIIWLPQPEYSHIVAEIVDSAEFTAYDYYPAVFNAGMAVRRKSPRFGEILRELRTVFARTYPGRDLDDYRAEPVARGPESSAE